MRKNPYGLLWTNKGESVFGGDWTQVIPVYDIATQSAINGLKNIFGKLGIPEVVVTDSGRQFVAKEFETFCTQLGIRHLANEP